jgi:hypothetical protein
MSVTFIYVVIGCLYWALNSFVRKLDTDGDWLLPLIWFVAWPIGFVSWIAVFIDYLLKKKRRKHF